MIERGFGFSKPFGASLNSLIDDHIADGEQYLTSQAGLTHGPAERQSPPQGTQASFWTLNTKNAILALATGSLRRNSDADSPLKHSDFLKI